MIRKSEISDTTLLIIVRFFAALHRVKKERKIRGIQTFCHAHGINRRNLYTLEHDIRGHSGMFDVSWLAFLVADHDVNPRWLLTGEGEFYDHILDEKTPNFTDGLDITIWELIRPILEKGCQLSEVRREAGKHGKGVSRNPGNTHAAKSSIQNQYKINTKSKQINTDKEKDKDMDKEKDMDMDKEKDMESV